MDHNCETRSFCVASVCTFAPSSLTREMIDFFFLNQSIAYVQTLCVCLQQIISGMLVWMKTLAHARTRSNKDNGVEYLSRFTA